MDFKLPELGEGVHEGELIKWKVKVGDTVRDDQILCEIMTDKATMEIPSPFAGTVTVLNAKEGQTVKVGETLIEYQSGAGTGAGAKTETKSEPKAESKNGSNASHSAPAMSAAKSASPGLTQSSVPASRGGAGTGAAMPTSASMSAATSAGPVRAAPSTRRAAREKGVDLGMVSGSGPHGRIMKEDLERMIGGGSGSRGGMSAPARGRPGGAISQPMGAETRVPFKGLRKRIAEKMTTSKHKAAHFTYVEEADATQLVRLREAAKEIGATQGVKVTYLPFIMKCMVAALRQYPILNSSLDEATGEIVYKNYYNIGLSVQTADGLTAPVIKDVEHKSIMELAQDIQNVVERARTNKLTLDDFAGGTITLTNAGSIGGLFATPVINYPEVAILGFNKIFRKPVVKTIRGRERLVIRDWTLFSISLDHRIVDGAVGAEFMKKFIQYVENPTLLLMENF